MATIETPVRLRAWVSAIARPAYGLPVDGQALDPLGQRGQVLDQPGRAQQLGQGVGLLFGELDDLLTGVGVLAVVDQQVAPAGAVGDDPELPAGPGGEVVAQPHPRQVRLLDVHPGAAPSHR
jgi:hypothetical protein